MSYIEEYRKIVLFVRRCERICGCDILDPKFHYDILTYLVFITITSYFTFCGYTIFEKFSAGWHVIMEVLCMCGSGFQGIAKIHGLFSYRPKMVGLFKFLEEVYLKYENRNEKFKEIFKRTARRTKFLFRGSCLVYILCIGSLLYVPLGILIFTGQRLLLMTFITPIFDVDTDFGYYTTNTIQIIVLIFGGVGNFASDMLFFILVSHVHLLKDILILKFDELNIAVLNKKDIKDTNIIIQDIFNWHQEYQHYMKTVSFCYHIIIFTQISSAALSICLTILSVIIGVWPMGFLYFIYAFVTLWEFSALGTLAEKANDEVCHSIYNVCIWYDLTVEQQKMLQIMLRQAQSPINFTVGFVMPLCVSSGLQVTKGIYSYMMFLVNFLE